MKHLVVISRHADIQADRLLKLAEWMGVSARRISLDDRPAPEQLTSAVTNKDGVAIDAATLAFLHEQWSPDVLQACILDRCAHLLVFSANASSEQGPLFRWLTGGAVTGLAPSAERQTFRFPESERQLNHSFKGLSFSQEKQPAVPAFMLGQPGSRELDSILLADEHPVFVRMGRGACELFLLSISPLPDISERLSANRGVEEYYTQLLPLLLFLRHCFGDTCWHGTSRTGRLIIDDPLLTKAYGYLDFASLRQSMRSAGYGTSVAFIPWNYWRSSRTEAAKVVDGSPELSICVHGCDHTNKEFEDIDPGSLRWKTDTALRRMARHKHRTGVAFDPVMVFPRGKFSSAAISALRAGGYLAAVNTTCFPSYGEAEPLTIADMLHPAVMKFHGFPIFQRRYPRRLIDFAFDIFLGRPVLIVQHHDDFREGYRAIEEFVAGLHKLEPALTWGPLSEQLVESCMVRAVSDDAMEVRFFTSPFKFKNTDTRHTAFIFSKEEPDASSISNVEINGKSIPFLVANGLLTFEHQVKPDQAIDVRVVDKPARPIAHDRPGMRHVVGVTVRRALSEFRDSTLAKYPRLMTAATAVATKLRVTGNTPGKRPS